MIFFFCLFGPSSVLKCGLQSGGFQGDAGSDENRESRLHPGVAV